jgi:hypothetical protein
MACRQCVVGASEAMNLSFWLAFFLFRSFLAETDITRENVSPRTIHANTPPISIKLETRTLFICITTNIAMLSAQPDVNANRFSHVHALHALRGRRNPTEKGRGPTRTVATVVAAEMHLVLPPGPLMHCSY